jgi:hypothetical protein
MVTTCSLAIEQADSALTDAANALERGIGENSESRDKTIAQIMKAAGYVVDAVEGFADIHPATQVSLR